MLVTEAIIIRAFLRKDRTDWKALRATKEFDSKCDSFWKEVEKLCTLREMITTDATYCLVLVLESNETTFSSKVTKKVETLINRFFGNKEEVKIPVQKVEEVIPIAEVKRRGRPVGSKNKEK